MLIVRFFNQFLAISYANLSLLQISIALITPISSAEKALETPILSTKQPRQSPKLFLKTLG
jgi:hypothetical protein